MLSGAVRVRFTKVGAMQFISHLDLQRTLARVLVRADIPMWYTQGFNPHAKVTFGLPLSVGTESECEFIDLRLDRDIPPAELRARLNRELTAEMEISDAYEPSSKFSDVAWARYEMSLRFAGADRATADRLQSLWTTPPLMMVKKNKSGDKEIDITPLVREIKVIYNDDRPGEIRVRALLSASEGSYLNPEMLIAAAKRELGILSGDPAREEYSILRSHVYLADGVTEFR